MVQVRILDTNDRHKYSVLTAVLQSIGIAPGRQISKTSSSTYTARPILEIWLTSSRLSPRTVDQPTLFIFATRDSVLTKDLSDGMEAYVSKLTRREVDATHWALWQQPEAVNNHIKDWLEGVVYGPKSTL